VIAVLAALMLLAPPHATVSSGSSHVPLAVSSWCWGTKCGAPISASGKTLVAHRGGTVTIDFAFDPVQVHVAIAGRRVAVAVHGHEASWHARAAGGLTVSVTEARGWVTYVGRLRVR
jgi:hypothetical protein